MARFSGKTILITGGSSGIGLAGAKRIAAEGGRVAITGLGEKHIETARRELPAETLVIRNDAADPDAAASLAESISGISALDGVWLNAGYAEVVSLEKMDAATFDRMMNANVRGPMLQMAHLSGLLKDGGSVLVTSSTSTYEGAPLTSLYAATKGAIVALVRAWAAELAPRNIRVNSLVPGPIETNFRDFMSDEFRKTFETSVVERVPLGRIGSAEEAAAVGLFLLSDDASYVTGSQYAVDGGLTHR